MIALLVMYCDMIGKKECLRICVVHLKYILRVKKNFQKFPTKYQVMIKTF